MFALNILGIVQLPDDIGACKHLSNLEASVNPIGKYVCCIFIISTSVCIVTPLYFFS